MPTINADVMFLLFEDDSLEELYEYGCTTNKKYKKVLTRDVIKKYKKTVDYLLLARKRADWFRFAGLNYEVLGSKGVESVRIDRSWRLLFRSTEDDKLVIKEISLIEISNHYGDN